MPDATGAPTATPPAELPEPIIIGEALPSGEPQTYVVEAGDSLFVIAEKLGVDPDELIRLNDLADPSSLEIGQVLTVPAAAPPPAETAPTPGAEVPEAPPPPIAEGGDTYTVQSGDNASAIADRCGFTLAELAAANGTAIDGLRSLEVGQVLRLPGPCVAPEPAPEPEPETPVVAPEVPELPPEAIEPTPEAPLPAPVPETAEPIPEATP